MIQIHGVSSSVYDFKDDILMLNNLQIQRTVHTTTVAENGTVYTESHCRAVGTPASYREIPGSNLSPDTGYTMTDVINGFPQSLQAKAGILT
jgi:hypothetical protein